MGGECRMAGVAVATPTLPVPHQHVVLWSLLAIPTTWQIRHWPYQLRDMILHACPRTALRAAPPVRLVHEVLSPAESSLVTPAGIVRHQSVLDVLVVTAHVRSVEVDGDRLDHIV